MFISLISSVSLPLFSTFSGGQPVLMDRSCQSATFRLCSQWLEMVPPQSPVHEVSLSSSPLLPSPLHPNYLSIQSSDTAEITRLTSRNSVSPYSTRLFLPTLTPPSFLSLSVLLSKQTPSVPKTWPTDWHRWPPPHQAAGVLRGKALSPPPWLALPALNLPARRG